MRRFLYFFPGVGGMSPKMLENFGVSDRFAASGGGLIRHDITPVDAGPSGGSGVIVSPGDRPLTDVPRADQWVQGEKFWVATDGGLPRPVDLERDVGIGGTEITLQDGCIWRVPLIHRWDTEKMRHVPNLPQSMALVGGKCVTRIRPEYQPADEIASRAFEAFFNSKTLPFEQVFCDAALLLAVNYRIGVEEAGLLGILDEAAIIRVLEICFDQRAMRNQAAELSGAGLHYVEPQEEM